MEGAGFFEQGRRSKASFGAGLVDSYLATKNEVSGQCGLKSGQGNKNFRQERHGDPPDLARSNRTNFIPRKSKDSQRAPLIARTELLGLKDTKRLNSEKAQSLPELGKRGRSPNALTPE